MKILRVLGLFVVFCCLAGCFGGRLRADKLMMAGRSDIKAGAYEPCIQHTTEAIGIYQTILNKPGNAPNQLGSLGGMASSYAERARCHWKLGHSKEAISDIETGLKLRNDYCHGDFEIGMGKYAREQCNQVADETETLAQWKKELAARGKETKP